MPSRIRLASILLAGTLAVSLLPLSSAGTPPAFALTPHDMSHDRADAAHAYEVAFEAYDQPIAFSRDSSLSSCTPGTATREAHDAAMASWNYLRQLSGVLPVTVPLAYTPTKYAQAAALTAAASSTASNFPASTPGSNCLSEPSNIASRSGVISRNDGIESPAREVLRYFTEASATNQNDSLGHRLQMMNPLLERSALGLVSVGTAGPSSSSIQLFPDAYNAASIPLNPPLWNSARLAPSAVSWPSAGYFPTTLLPTGLPEGVSRWHVGMQCADLTSAQVTILDPQGRVVPGVQVVHSNEPGVQAGLRPWTFAGYDNLLLKIPSSSLNLPSFYDTHTYTVQLTDIQQKTQASCVGASVPNRHSYGVKLFNPEWPSEPNGDADRDGTPNYLDPRPRIPDIRVDRLAGTDRIETAVRIARSVFPDSAPVVYVARANVLVDALVAGVLHDGPILLVPSTGQVPQSVLSTIEALRPRQVIALGGTQAVSDQVLRSLAAPNRSISRLGGVSREETSLLIARRAFPNNANSLYLADAYGKDGQGSPDALVGGALKDGPIVLVDNSSPKVLGAGQLAVDLKVSRVVALGGPSVMSGSVLRQVGGTLSATRLSGSDRYATSQAIAHEVFRQNPNTTTAYLARGTVFADAVAAGVVTDGPLLLVPDCQRLPAYTAQTLRDLKAYKIVGLGGRDAICDYVFDQALTWPSDAPVTWKPW
ncbi:MAG: cell wall-binding repeat-containing protein [Actinomycetaceae bacterium]|nr:cell wall-binding repeat-containing protein [Actinomycetaceae bacterium]